MLVGEDFVYCVMGDLFVDDGLYGGCDDVGFDVVW